MAFILQQRPWKNEQLKAEIATLFDDHAGSANTYKYPFLMQNIIHWYAIESDGLCWIYVRAKIELPNRGVEVFRFSIPRDEFTRFQFLFDPGWHVKEESSLCSVDLVVAYAMTDLMNQAEKRATKRALLREYEQKRMSNLFNNISNVQVELVDPTERGSTNVLGDIKRQINHLTLLETIPKRSSLDDPTFGWRCTCPEEWFCDSTEAFLARAESSWSSIDTLPQEHFNLAVPVYGHVLHHIKVKRTLETEWNGETYFQYEITVPMIQQEISRYYTANDWMNGVVSPIDDILEWIYNEMKVNPSAKNMVASAYLFINGTVGAPPCPDPAHNLGSNRKLLSVLTSGQQAINAHVFSMMQYSRCLACTTSQELAFALAPNVT